MGKWRYLAQLISGREIIGTTLHRAIGFLLFQTRHSNLKKFIQHLARDAQESQALEQGHRVILGLSDHAAHKLQLR